MQKTLHHLFCSSLLILLASGNTKAAPCTGDVIFTNITITSISSGNYQYSYEIQNNGTSDISFNQLIIQNYVSADNQVGGDAAAGGGFIDHLSTGVLAAVQPIAEQQALTPSLLILRVPIPILGRIYTWIQILSAMTATMTL